MPCATNARMRTSGASLMAFVSAFVHRRLISCVSASSLYERFVLRHFGGKARDLIVIVWREAKRALRAWAQACVFEHSARSRDDVELALEFR